MKNQELTIVIDKQEKKPLAFSCQTVRGHMKTGDYTVLGHEDGICIERKSISDLIGSCSRAAKKGKKSNRQRLEEEVGRMHGSFRRYCILVEGNEEDVLKKCKSLYSRQWKAYVRKAKSAKKRGYRLPRKPIRPEVRCKAVFQTLKKFRVNYNCRYFFAGSRANSSRIIERMCGDFVRKNK